MTWRETTGADATAPRPTLDFNWNVDPHPLTEVPTVIPAAPTVAQLVRLQLLSECLRDGLQGTRAYPPVDGMLEYLHLLRDFGIRHATVGIFPGSSESLSRSMKTVLSRMARELPDMVPKVLSLCTDDSQAWVYECREQNPQLESVVFMGSSPSRRLVQNWDIPFITDKLSTYIARTVEAGIPVIAGTEHTSQTSPEDVRAILEAQVLAGATGIAIADTIGTIRPTGTYRLVTFLRSELERLGRSDAIIDWHGHRDTGNALGNSIAACAAGADRIHVVSRGVGERSGNTSLEEVALNVATMLTEHDLPVPWNLSLLLPLITAYQEMVGVEPPEHGVLGRRYNHTSSGIHTDAILKAHAMADAEFAAGDLDQATSLRRMARTVYSAVDPETIGGTHSIGVSPWSGKSAVMLAYRATGRPPFGLSAETIAEVLARANDVGRELTPDELEAFFSADEVVPS